MKMTRIVALFALLSVAAPFAFADSHMEAAKTAAKSKTEKMGKMDMTATLEAKERQVMEAFKNRDAKTFMSLVDADAWQIDPMGLAPVSSVPEMMNDMEVRSYTVADYKTHVINADVCVATFTWNADASMKGEALPAGPWYCSTVWAKRGKEWKAVFHQETLSMQGMAPPAAAGN